MVLGGEKSQLVGWWMTLVILSRSCLSHWWYQDPNKEHPSRGVLFKLFGWWLTVLKYTLVNIQKAIENGRLWLIYPLKMVIFHSHVNVYQRVYVGLYCFGIFQCQALLLLACAKVLPPIPLLSSSVDECFMPCNSILATMQRTPWPTAWCTQGLCHKLVINQLAKYWGPNLVLFSCECKSCVVKPPFCQLNVFFVG